MEIEGGGQVYRIANRPDPRHRIIGLALLLAAYPRAHKHEHAFEAGVPWRLIIKLREALTEAGVDAIHAELSFVTSPG